MLTRARLPKGLAGVVLAAGVSVAAVQACLKSEDEIEIVDASLGTPTPRPTRTPTSTPKPYFLDAFTSNLVANLTLSDADAKQLTAAITAGQNGQKASGAAASEALAKAIADASTWLVDNEKVEAQPLARANAGAGLLFAGYFAAEKEAGSDAALFDAHLKALAAALGQAFTTFVGVVAPTSEEYASFALTIVNNVFTQFNEGGLAAAKVKALSTLLIAELATAFTALPTLMGTDLSTYVDGYAKNAGVVIASLATETADRQAYLEAYRDGLKASLLAAIPASEAAAVDGIEASLQEGVAGATPP